MRLSNIRHKAATHYAMTQFLEELQPDCVYQLHLSAYWMSGSASCLPMVSICDLTPARLSRLGSRTPACKPESSDILACLGPAIVDSTPYHIRLLAMPGL